MFFSSRPHTGLLWALENLAWSPEYLSQASLALAKLTAFDPNPESNYTNRPHNSLSTIFLCWLPQTAATLEQRLRVIDLLRKRVPDVAWNLCRSILPANHTITSETHIPEWREWAPDPRPGVTNGELWNATDEIGRRLLEDIGQSGQRWCEVIGSIQSLTSERFLDFIQRLSSIELSLFTPEDRLLVWNRLRELISHHRQFAYTDWALPENILEDLERAYERFTPDDLIARFAWYFTGYPALLKLSPADADNWEVREAFLRNERQNALRSIYISDGLSGLFKLATQVAHPGEVGFLVEQGMFVTKDDENSIFRQIFTENLTIQALAHGFIDAKIQSVGSAWLDTQFTFADAQLWTKEQRILVFTCFPLHRVTWDRLDNEDQETRQGYWRQVVIWRLTEPADCERACENLLQYARPYEALFLLHWHIKREPPLPAILIEEALQRAAQTNPPERLDLSSFSYVVSELMDTLSVLYEIDESKLALLEWMYLTVLKHRRDPQILYRESARNPQFFLDLISCVYKAENEDAIELTQEEKFRWRQSYNLLEGWRIVPGMQVDGKLDVDALKNWVRETRGKAKSVGRLDPADMRIGQVFAHAPIGTDGIWPDIAIRDLLEVVNSSAMEDGLLSQIYSNRGAVTKSLLEGGGQERQLAEKYKSYATATRDCWPRISSVLRSMSEKYASEARRSDKQAELEEDLGR